MQIKKYRFLSVAPNNDKDDDISDESDMEDDGAVGNDNDDVVDDGDDDEVGDEEEKKAEEEDKEVVEEGLEHGGNEEEQDEGGVRAEEVETHELGEHEQDNTDAKLGEEITQTTVQDVSRETHPLQLEKQEEPVEEHPEKKTIFE